MAITPLDTFSMNSSDTSQAGRLSLAASDSAAQGDDWAPSVKHLKLGRRCVECLNAQTNCVPLDKNVASSICLRCFDGGYTCNYAFLKPNLVEKCDRCKAGNRVCPKPTSCQECSAVGSKPCVHEECNRCKGIGKPCNWEGAKRSKALNSLWQRTAAVSAIRAGTTLA